MGKLKILAIIAVFMAVAQASVPIPGQAANRAAPESQKQDEGGKGSQNPAKTISPASKPENGNNRDLKPEFLAGSETYAQPTINITNPVPAPVPWPLHDKILWWANLIFAGVGICGVVAAVCTLRILNRQTNHMITSERAWIICKVDNLCIPNVAESFAARTMFQLENVGKTPGFILEYGWKIVDLRSDEHLPDSPTPYTCPDCDFATYDRLPISPHGSISLLGQVVAQDPRVFHLGERVVWIHGYIRYCDCFSSAVHETRTCFKWTPGRINTGIFEFSIDGPLAYNRAT